MAKKVTAEALFKALDDLEEKLTKSEPDALPKSTKQANGGLAAKAGGEGEEADLDAGAEDSSAKSTEEEDDLEKAAASDEESSESTDDEESSPVSKSVRESMDEDDEIAKSIEVSSFMEHLVDQSSAGIDRLAKSLDDVAKYQHDFNARLAKALVKMGEKLETLESQLSTIGDQPSGMAKAITARAVQSGEAMERFEGEEAPEFSKSDALDALVELATAGKVHASMVAQFESTNHLPAEVVGLVTNHLRRK